jgi:hypothetical protein
MSGVEAETPRGALPAGEYQAVITDSELKPTKNGSGQFLELVLQVQDGPYKGRKIWDRLNLFNNNAQAVAIAKQRLKAIQDSVGVPNPGDSVQLHNRLLTVTVDVREYEGRESNEVKGYAVKRSSGQPMTQTSYPAPTAGQMANPFG